MSGKWLQIAHASYVGTTFITSQFTYLNSYIPRPQRIMPAVSEDDQKTVAVQPKDLAEYLDITRTYLSRATQNRWNAKGVDVELYAVYKTRNENYTSHYELPVDVAVSVIPPSELKKYDL